MAKKDKAKRRAEDDRGAVTEEVSKTVDDAQHVAGGVASSLKDAVASGVGTVAETTTHAVSSVTHAVSSAIEKVRLPFPRARALLSGLPPSSLTPRPVILVSSERPPRRRWCRGTRRNRTAPKRGRAPRRSTRTKTERSTRKTPPRSADDAHPPSASSHETPQTSLLGSFRRRTVSDPRGAGAAPTTELFFRREKKNAVRLARGKNLRAAPPRSPARKDARHRYRGSALKIQCVFLSTQRL